MEFYFNKTRGAEGTAFETDPVDLVRQKRPKGTYASSYAISYDIGLSRLENNTRPQAEERESVT